MRVTVEIEPYDDKADPSNHTGLTEAAYHELIDAIMEVGEVVNIRKGA